MIWKTRITELLGCKYPILEGAYGYWGGWKFAAAVANTGAYGLITSTVAKTPEKLRECIHHCRDHTDGTFGVNLTFGFGGSQLAEMLEVCVDERVPVETAGFRPDSLAPRIKQAGLTWIHKTARVKDALHAEKLGADAVIVVGLEGVGFKNIEQMPTMITTILAKRCLKVPQDEWLLMLESVLAKNDYLATLSDKNIPINKRIDIEKFQLFSLSAMLIDDLPTVKELIDRLVHGAEELIDSYEFLKK